MIEPLTPTSLTGFSPHPYPGLRPFTRSEGDIFFGRQEHIAQILEKLETSRFVAIVGSSGSGKSSLVHAGLIPALDAGLMARVGPKWVTISVRPGNDPIVNLAKALLATPHTGQVWSRYANSLDLMTAVLRRGPDGIEEILRQGYLSTKANLLIVIDQFEELFRYHRHGDENQSIEFVDLLLNAAQQTEQPVYVALTMRSDFIGECSLFNGLPEALNRGQYLVPRLTRQQCREAIVGPATAFGISIEDRLVTQLLNDMRSDKDQLPLMQHVLLRMWREQLSQPSSNRRFTLEAYQRLGGLEHALSNHADEIFCRLPTSRQYIATSIFQCLTERVSGNRDSRRPVSFEKLVEVISNNQPPHLFRTNEPLTSTLDYRHDISEVVDIFRSEDCNFLTPAQPGLLTSNTMVDITHESLIRQWKRLREWVDSEYQAGQTYRRMLETAKLWKQDRAALWRTPDLETGLAWKSLGLGPLWAERYGGEFAVALEFLEKSQLEQQRLDEIQQSQIARELNLTKQAAARLRLLLTSAVTVCVLTLAVSVFIYSLWQNQQYLRNLADQARENATAQTRQLQQVNTLLSSIISDVDPYSIDSAVDLRAQLSERLRTAATQLQEDLSADTSDALRLDMLIKIAHAMNHMGADQSALELLEKILVRIEGSPNLHSQRIVDCRNQLLECRGFRPQQSRLDFAKQTMDLAVSRLTERSPVTLTSMSNYAKELREAKQNYQAREIDTRVFEQRKAILGDKHPDTLLSMQNLALDHELLLMHSRAIELYQEAIELRKQSTASSSEEQFDLLYCKLAESLSHCYSSLSWPEKAIPLEQELLAAYEKHLGKDHQLTLRCYSSLCENYLKRKQLSSAQDMAIQIAQKYELKLGSDDPETLSAKSRLAHIFLEMGKIREARDEFQSVFETRRSILGLHNILTLESLCDMANCNTLLGETNENIGSLNEVLATCTVLYGEDHEVTKYLQNRVRGDYYIHERQTAAQTVYGVDWCPSNLAAKKPGSEFPKANCSFISGYDRLDTLHDGAIDFRLTNSNRWTAYQSPHAEDWIEIDFGEEIAFSKVAIYFYEDGGVTPPQSYRLSYRQGDEYKEIESPVTTPVKPTSNIPNIVQFPEIKSRAIRVTFTHQAETRTGVTELLVSNESATNWILRGHDAIAARKAKLSSMRNAADFKMENWLLFASETLELLKRNSYSADALEIAEDIASVRGENLESLGALYDVFQLQYQQQRYGEARETVVKLISLVQNAERPEELKLLQVLQLVIDIKIGQNLPALRRELEEFWDDTSLNKSSRYNLLCGMVQLAVKLERGSDDEKQQAVQLMNCALDHLEATEKEPLKIITAIQNDPDLVPMLKLDRVTKWLSEI